MAVLHVFALFARSISLSCSQRDCRSKALGTGPRCVSVAHATVTTRGLPAGVFSPAFYQQCIEIIKPSLLGYHETGGRVLRHGGRGPRSGQCAIVLAISKKKL